MQKGLGVLQLDPSLKMRWAVAIQRLSMVIQVAATGPLAGSLCTVQRGQRHSKLNHQVEVIKKFG